MNTEKPNLKCVVCKRQIPAGITPHTLFGNGVCSSRCLEKHVQRIRDRLRGGRGKEGGK
jgi:predicted nucleic acid-binding Zn ribbon protein